MFSASFKMFARAGAVVAAPTISTQPNVASGAGRWDGTTILKKATAVSSVISVTASGSGLSYQWYKNGSVFSGKTSTSFTLSGGSGGTDAASDAALYYCIISNAGGSVTSSTLALSCLFPEAGDFTYTFATGLNTMSAKVWGASGANSNGDSTYGSSGGAGGGGGAATATVSFSGYTSSYSINMHIAAANGNGSGASGEASVFYTKDNVAALVSSIVAGGGGGADAGDENNGNTGGQGGGSSGGAGSGTAGYSTVINGKGGTSSAGGAGGTAVNSGYAGTGPEYTGTFNGGSKAAGYVAGSGGGGYYGGGGGGYSAGINSHGSGGGGSGVLFNTTSGTMYGGTDAYNQPANSSDTQRYTNAGLATYPGCICIIPVT